MANILDKIINRIYPPQHLAFYGQRMLSGRSQREFVSRLACKFLPPIATQATSYSEGVSQLQTRGYTMLDDLVSPEQVKAMVEYFAHKLVYDRWNQDGGMFDPMQPPAECHTAPFTNTDIVHSPHAIQWANHPKVLEIVEHVLGAKPTVSNMSVWWSYPGHDTPQEAENFHRDVDDLRFIKLFIYLSDVDERAGPHVFVPTSQNHPGFKRIRRYSDEEVEQEFGRDGIHYFTGLKGSAFLENTYGLHKGQLPTHTRRLLFQVQYSLHPIGIYKYQPLPTPACLGVDVDRYINRLYLK
ncbi:phytanoyl-CoA dioxygenase family protein [Pseudomonas urmiensis]|uniref:phytanoyl-CoA dioxygenase family protein n=1 Tax=Pseudomonas urmiensis TaxID=2745493 RepID=UPI0034D56297